MWVVNLVLTLAVLYAVIITVMYFAQTWLLFPAALARATRLQLPTSTQRLEVRTPNGERLAGVRIPSEGATTEGAPTLLGFGGNAWNAEATAFTLHTLFPHRNVVAFHYRGYAPSTGRPRARCSRTPSQSSTISREPRPASPSFRSASASALRSPPISPGIGPLRG